MSLTSEQQAYIYELSESVGALLKVNDHQLITAESCTGGWIAQAITAIPGSSSWFNSGIVSYSNNAKHKILGVPSSTLETCGAVSKEVVEAMACGAIALGFGDVSIAVSGIAGPDGGTDSKPVGTVWIAWSVGDQVDSHCFTFLGDREGVRHETLLMSLRGLIERLT